MRWRERWAGLVGRDISFLVMGLAQCKIILTQIWANDLPYVYYPYYAQEGERSSTNEDEYQSHPFFRVLTTWKGVEGGED